MTTALYALAAALVAAAPAALADEPCLERCAPREARSRDAAPPEATEDEPAVLVSHNVRHGGFGGPVVQFGEVAGRSAVFAGARGAWLIDRRFFLGGAGYGLATRQRAPQVAQTLDEPLDVLFGWGGLWFGTVLRPNDLVHVVLSGTIGAGGITYGTRSDWGRREGRYTTSDAVFVAQPMAELELNLSRWVRVTGGFGWRFVGGLEMPGLKNTDLGGWTASAGLAFGKF